jgi:hypothetical protein
MPPCAAYLVCEQAARRAIPSVASRQVRAREKKPFSLPNESRKPTPISMSPLHTHAKLRSAHFARLEGFHRHPDVRNSANFWNCNSEPNRAHRDRRGTYAYPRDSQLGANSATAHWRCDGTTDMLSGTTCQARDRYALPASFKTSVKSPAHSQRANDVL